MTLETGTQLDPYEIMSPLGAGGRGEVYRVIDTRLDREIAAGDAVALLPNSCYLSASVDNRFGPPRHPDGYDR